MTVSGENAITGPEIRPLRGFTWTCAMTVLNNRYDGRSLRGGVKPQVDGIPFYSLFFPEFQNPVSPAGDML